MAFCVRQDREPRTRGCRLIAAGVYYVVCISGPRLVITHDGAEVRIEPQFLEYDLGINRLLLEDVSESRPVLDASANDEKPMLVIRLKPGLQDLTALIGPKWSRGRRGTSDHSRAWPQVSGDGLGEQRLWAQHFFVDSGRTLTEEAWSAALAPVRRICGSASHSCSMQAYSPPFRQVSGVGDSVRPQPDFRQRPLGGSAAKRRVATSLPPRLCGRRRVASSSSPSGGQVGSLRDQVGRPGHLRRWPIKLSAIFDRSARTASRSLSRTPWRVRPRRAALSRLESLIFAIR